MSLRVLGAAASIASWVGCTAAPRATTVLSFQDLDCSDCGEEVARALIEHPKVYKTAFDKQKVELTVVADPSLDVRALAAEKREEEDDWKLVPGGGHGRYAEAEKPAELDVLELTKGGADVPLLHDASGAWRSLDVLAVNGKVTIVDLYATWCGPCHDLDAHIVEAMRARPGIAYRRLEVGDWDTPLGAHFLAGVKELPYVVIYSADGTRVAELVGFDPARFDEALENASRTP